MLNPISPAVANVRQSIRDAKVQIVKFFLNIGFGVEERFLDGFGRKGSGRSHALQLRLTLSERLFQNLHDLRGFFVQLSKARLIHLARACRLCHQRHGRSDVLFLSGSFFQLFNDGCKAHRIVHREKALVFLYQLCGVVSHGAVGFAAVLSGFQDFLLNLDLISQPLGRTVDLVVDAPKFLCEAPQEGQRQTNAKGPKSFRCKLFEARDGLLGLFHAVGVNLEQDLVHELSDYRFLRRHLLTFLLPLTLEVYLLNVTLHPHHVIEQECFIQRVNRFQFTH